MCVKPGMVFYLPFYELIGQRGAAAPKFAIVARTDPELLLLMVCTDIPAFASSNQRLSRSYIKIDVENHGFLEYDSWVDCNDAKDEYTLDSLEAARRKEPGCLVGEVSLDVLRMILGGVDRSTRLERRKRDSISRAINTRISERMV